MGSESPACVFTIGTTCIRLQSQAAGLIPYFERQYRQFLSADKPHLSIEIHWRRVNRMLLASPPFTFVDGRLWLTADGVNGMISVPDGAASLFLEVDQPVDVVDYFVRAATALMAFEKGGVMLHGAGIVRHDKAFVFFGHSGSGKTTVARLSAPHVVLNDDLVVLTPQADGWRVHATPFSNRTQLTPVSQSAPLAGLYRLAQASRVWLEPLTGGHALAELISSIPVVPADPGRSARLLERCSQLVASVPCYRLHFLPDDSFWQVVLHQA